MMFESQQSADFSALDACRSSMGPNSNTGQKLDTVTAPIVDFLTVVLPEKALKIAKCGNYHELLESIFGTHDEIKLGPIMERPFNFYPLSATMVDSTGSICGKIGLQDNGSMCISLSGQGTQHVKKWNKTYVQLEELGAKITRLDIAVDDLAGSAFNVQTFLAWQQSGEFNSQGRPPSAQFVDDLGSGKGCTLYIGQKGYKQLCIYEKGKQLGDPESTHVRTELRLYAKHREIPLDALINLGEYFAGAYDILARFVQGEATQGDYKERCVEASGIAMFRFAKNQLGTTYSLLRKAFGEHCMDIMDLTIAREGRPGRFKKFHGDLPLLIQTTLTDKLGESHN